LSPQSRRAHLSVVSDAADTSHHDLRRDQLPMLSDLEKVDQATVEGVAMDLQVNGIGVSAAVVAMRQAAEEAGRAGQWSEIVDSVGTAFAELGLRRAQELTPAFLASAHRDLIGTGTFTPEHYDAMTASWRTHIGRIHPEDESLKPGEPAVFGCGPRELSTDETTSWQDMLRGPHT
jgi:hypothetical protein